MLIGLVAGLLCYGAVLLKDVFKYDDSLDVVGVHMVGGIIGVVLIGGLASLVVNPAGPSASLALLGRQSLLTLVTVAYPFFGTLVILKLTDRMVGLRAAPEDEEAGLDLSQHGEIAYLLGHPLTDPALVSAGAARPVGGDVGAVRAGGAAEAP